jgi:hypothetical protein
MVDILHVYLEKTLEKTHQLISYVYFFFLVELGME